MREVQWQFVDTCEESSGERRRRSEAQGRRLVPYTFFFVVQLGLLYILHYLQCIFCQLTAVSYMAVRVRPSHLFVAFTLAPRTLRDRCTCHEIDNGFAQMVQPGYVSPPGRIP